MTEQEYSNLNPKPFGLIYLVRNLSNDKIYVGMTTKTIHVRKLAHEGEAKRNSQKVFHKALRRYGQNNFSWEILDFCYDDYLLPDLERWYIFKYDCFASKGKGYNVHEGGFCGHLCAGKSDVELKEIYRQSITTRSQTIRNRTEEEKQRISAQQTLRNYQMWENRTEEERNEIVRKREESKQRIEENKSEQDKEKDREFRSQQAKLQWEQKTEQQILEFKQNRSRAQIEYFQNISDEDKDEWKEKISITKRGKKNPMAKSVVCVESGIIYETITEAAFQVYNDERKRSYISKSIEKGIAVCGFSWKVVDISNEV
jgi:group I intron endonuclease